MSADPSISAFNDNLIRAKLAALQILQDLVNSLCDPDPPIPARFRELRLLASAILRTQPMKPSQDDRPGDATPATPDTPPSPEPTSPPSNGLPPTPALQAPTTAASLAPPSLHAARRFNPHQDWARTALRSLVKDGYLPKFCAVFPGAPPTTRIQPARPPP